MKGRVLMIKPLTHEDIVPIIFLFKKTKKENNFFYQVPTEAFLESAYFDNQSNHDHCFKYTIDNEMVGFMLTSQIEQTAYIDMIIVKKQNRHQGIARQLLNHLEECLINHEAIKLIEVSFFSPVHFSWDLPNTPSRTHPNAPGVSRFAMANNLFKACNYSYYATQNVYFKTLNNPSNIHVPKQLNHLSFTYYDTNKHQGYETLSNDLNNPTWTKAIHQAVLNNTPVIMAFDQEKPIGFAGPLYVHENGLGYFAGIGVMKDYQGQGIGKILFSLLCQKLFHHGANYMSLFTGTNNKAHYLYTGLGFEIVASFNNYRKTIKK